MSRLYKSNSIVVGDPLEIEVEILLSEENNPQGAPSENIAPRGDTRKEIGHILEKARIRSTEIIDKALTQGEDIRVNAQREGYRKGYKEGRQEGFAEGYEKGRQEGFAVVDKALEEALEIRTRALEGEKSMVKEAEAEIVQIIMEISKKVLGEQVKTEPEAVLGLVRKALDKCIFSDKVTMKISPEDYDLVEQSKKKLLSGIEGITRLDIIAEEALPQGSCVLETDGGNISSGIEVQLHRIEHAFKELLNYE